VARRDQSASQGPLRLLLVDNHDSYTFNLFQLLAAVNAQAPLVVRNDDPRLATLTADDVDALVISPGPGRPQCPTDLGWSGELLRQHPELPVLGVCLGHQAIALTAGARVVEGTPRHGFVDRIRHDREDVFAGVPDRFQAVRYHSLHVRDLPEELIACAWADDGTVMGLRHRDLPRWGLQFHPESVATEHGSLLVRNFLQLAADRGAPPARTRCPPTGTTPAATGEAAPADRLEVLVHRLERESDPEQAFVELCGDSPRSFWLDSSLVEPGRSRFSFIGDDSGPLAETLTYRVGDSGVDMRRLGRLTREPGSIFDVLEARLRARRVPDAGLPFAFDGGEHVPSRVELG